MSRQRAVGAEIRFTGGSLPIGTPVAKDEAPRVRRSGAPNRIVDRRVKVPKHVTSKPVEKRTICEAGLSGCTVTATGVTNRKTAIGTPLPIAVCSHCRTALQRGGGDS